MNVRRLAVMVVLTVGLAGCGADEEAGDVDDLLMPEVTGLQLNVALAAISDAGFGDDVDVDGGGIFGVVDESNWQVCGQSPAGGQPISDAPQLRVERTCEEQIDDSAPSDELETTDPDEPTPDVSEPSETDSPGMEVVFIEALGGQDIKDMCDPAYTHWACFYDGAEETPGYLQVDLLTDGGWTDEDLEELANSAGRHWFNFIGCAFPDLTIIVVSINGVDHNVYRHNTMVDTMCR